MGEIKLKTAEKILTWAQWLPVVGIIFAFIHSLLGCDNNANITDEQYRGNSDPGFIHIVYQIFTWVAAIFIFAFWKGGN